MRRRLLALALAALCAFGGLGFSALARAQDDDHGGHGRIVLDELSIEQRQEARKIFAEIVCKCPNENWSKSLLNCPDGCADQQKQEILEQIVLGWDENRIVDYQVQAYGPRTLGKPDDVMTYLLPVLVLLGAVVVVGVVFVRWRRSAAAAKEERVTTDPADADELAAVERELQELR